jgi:nucleoside-diphosphate-sugar epimerase
MPELVALTGATGFIGTALLNSFTRTGIKVRALSRQAKPDSDLVEWVTGDLNSPQALRTLIDGADTIIHCAGVVRGKSNEEFLANNSTGTANLIAACDGQSEIKRFLLISSLAAKHPELSWYAFSKYKAEQALKSGRNKLPGWTILRPTAVYGPGDKEIRPLLQAMKMGLLTVPNTNSKFSLIHINDLVIAIMLWATQTTPVEGVYELDDGTANGYNWEKLIELAKSNWGKSVFKIPIPVTLLKMLAITNLGLAKLFQYSPMLTPGKIQEITHPDWTCDNTLISSTLNWHPSIQLSDAMQDPSLLQL